MLFDASKSSVEKRSGLIIVRSIAVSSYRLDYFWCC